MIFARMEGRNGNQMFVFAAAYALAKRMGQHVFFDCVSNYENNPDGHKFVLDYFPEVNKFIDPLSDRKIKTETHLLYGKYFANDCGHVFENSDDLSALLSSFTPDTLRRNGVSNLFLHGFFQNERYFADAKDDIRKFFRFPAPDNPKSQELIEFLQSVENPVAVTIRRGDYVTNPLAVQLFGNICPTEYYMAAFREIEHRVSNPYYIFFSDDPEWVKNNLPAPKHSIFVDWTKKSNPAFEDMMLSSKCRHYILANSSYCWWGAWLWRGEERRGEERRGEEKIVVAPPRWFNDDRYAALDKGIVPDRWLRLKYR